MAPAAAASHPSSQKATERCSGTSCCGLTLARHSGHSGFSLHHCTGIKGSGMWDQPSSLALSLSLLGCYTKCGEIGHGETASSCVHGWARVRDGQGLTWATQDQQNTCPHGVDVGWRRVERHSGHCAVATGGERGKAAAVEEAIPSFSRATAVAIVPPPPLLLACCCQ